MSSIPLTNPEALLADVMASSATTGAVAPLPAMLDVAAAAANIVGTAGNDTLNGSANADQIFGLGGNDTLNGRAGNDILFGGEGNDVLTGGIGDDQLFGEAGDDRFIWNTGDGNDIVEGGGGIDRLEINGDGNAENTQILNNGTRVFVSTTTNGVTSTLDIADVENLVVRAGGGDDTLVAGNGIATLTNLTLDGGDGNDAILGGDGNDTLLGGSGNDFIDGNRGNDTASLGGGNDVFGWDPGDGSDVVEGNGGTDTLQFNGSNANEQMVLSASGSHAVLTRDVAAITMDLHGMENVNIRALGGTDNITVGDLRGTDVNQVHVDLAASDGSDDTLADTVTVALTAGNDAVAFNAGATVINGLGAQVFVENQGVGDRFVIDGGEGIDTITASGTGGDDTIGIAFDGTGVAVFTPGSSAISVSNVEQLLIKGGAGNDTLSASNGIATLTNLTLDGGTGNDTILGGDGNDILLGGDGNDFVDGNRGNDVASLGAGNDVFGWDPGDGSDTVEGNGGIDTLQFNGSNVGEEMVLSASGSHAILTRNVAAITMDLHGMENVNIRALGGTDNITVGDLRGTDVNQVHVDLAPIGGGDDNAADTVTVALTADNDALGFAVGTSALNGLGAQVFVENQGVGDRFVIDGGEGIDTVTASGSGGDDTIGIAFDGTGVAVFTPGSSAISVSNVEQLLVKGGDGNDTIVGQNGIATLTQLTLDGGAGNDTILGGDGNDVLLAGGGNDFVDGNRGNDTASLGDGDDVFGWDPGDGSDTVEGGTSTDTLQFNGSNAGEEMVLTASGSHAILTRNVGAITMDLHGMENVNIRALGAADLITVQDMTGTDVKHVNIDLSSSTGGGDSANDVVAIQGTNAADVIHLSMQNGALVVDGLAAQIVVQNFEAGDQIQVFGLGGDDVIDASALPAGASILLNGGDGDDVVLGGDGNDMLLGGAGDDVLIGGPGFDALDGGSGDNVLIQDGGNALFAADASATDVVDHAPLSA
jgi:Ca2+-binding RTX toxin-like protein